MRAQAEYRQPSGRYVQDDQVGDRVGGVFLGFGGGGGHQNSEVALPEFHPQDAADAAGPVRRR